MKIIENNLKRASIIKTLKLKNENYNITIFYYGDYEADLENKTIDKKNISVVCKKETRGALSLLFSEGTIHVDIDCAPTISLEEVETLQTQLKIAKEAAIELNQILHEYFQIA